MGSVSYKTPQPNFCGVRTPGPTRDRRLWHTDTGLTALPGPLKWSVVVTNEPMQIHHLHIAYWCCDNRKWYSCAACHNAHDSPSSLVAHKLSLKLRMSDMPAAAALVSAQHTHTHTHFTSTSL